MKVVLCTLLFFAAAGLFAAPLEGGFSLAPRASASTEERERAFVDVRSRVISAARTYEGTPYVYGAMSSAAVDCSGLIYLSFRDALGVTLPRSAAGLYSWVERIPVERAQPGDLLFFRTDTTRNITHVGLYLGNNRFIHAASAGSTTGVIYSSLNEDYYSNAFAGAGRAFPEAASIRDFDIDSNVTAAIAVSGAREPEFSSGGRERLLVSVGLAPVWNGFLKDGNLLRGFASHVSLVADTCFIGPRMVFGLEIRPEYDGALGVFRLPITLSWGLNEKFKIFAGPVLSFGDAVISTSEGERRYSGGTTWFGTAGITAAPFILNTAAGDFAPYLELAWQSYFSENQNPDLNADFSANFRFSTGLRWTIQVH